MTAEVDIVNRALQNIGTRTTVTATELANNTTNEAIQSNIILRPLRDELLRMAPWNCAFNYANLTVITAASGTPENTAPVGSTWQKGLPPPPWSYEYQYPVNCLRPCFIVPQFQSGFTGGTPITTAITGGAASFWQGPPVKFRVAIDQFFPVTSATVSAGGTGYAVGDQITLAGTPAGQAPIGAPAVLQVATIGGGGAVATVTVVNQVAGESSPLGGSYFAQQTNPVAQGSTTGAGTGATFNLSYGAQGDQRIILCNQEFALLAYVKQVTDPNVMDPQFIAGWAHILGSRLAIALTGDKQLANLQVAEANRVIIEARKSDGNEGLTINDVTPDWIRRRGINYSDYPAPNIDFNWGNLWTPY